jgi:hypothetical protein
VCSWFYGDEGTDVEGETVNFLTLEKKGEKK